MSRRPLLAVDVDGVVALFGPDELEMPEGTRLEVVDGQMLQIPAGAGERLQRLSACYDLVWATGWEGRANQLAQVLDIPELPYLSFGSAARFGSADWKLTPLHSYAAGRALAWIDDSFDERCYEWARGRADPTLLIPTESHLGLDEVHVEALIAWACGLG